MAGETASLGPQHSEYGPPPPSVIAPPRQTLDTDDAAGGWEGEGEVGPV